MTQCKKCGQQIVWPQPYNPNKPSRPLEPDGTTIHDCPAFKKDNVSPTVAKEIESTQAMVDEEARKREVAASQSKDERIEQYHKENREDREAYRDLYKKDIEAKLMVSAAITKLGDELSKAIGNLANAIRSEGKEKFDFGRP